METTGLIKFDQARQALMEAKTVDEVKEIRDKVEALRMYLKQQGASLEMQNHCAEISVRASRRAGEMLAEMPKNKGLNGSSVTGNTVLPVRDDTPTLEEIGLTKMQSSRFQAIASIPQEVFEQAIAETKTGQKELTSKDMQKVAKRAKRQAEKANREAEARQAKKLPDWLIIGDFREVGHVIADNSIDLIFTDPPYNKEAAQLYIDLAEFASRKLKPGGLCITYSGQMHLPKIYAGMGQHLEYMWTCAIGHSGGDTAFHKWRITNLWKPLLVYGKPPILAWWDKYFDDYTTGGKEKDTHPWQQALSEAEHFIKAVCPAGGLVLDPFAGGGTTLLAAKNSGFQHLGIEKDKEAIDRIIDRMGS